MSQVTVIDAPCGAGKTSWAIQEMRRHPEKRYVYCTPFLDEITRIRTACPEHRFSEPNNYGHTKLDDFNRLLKEQRNIAVTHSTFLNATPETIELIRAGDYTIIIDEALDVVEEFNHIRAVERNESQSIVADDVKKALDGGFIEIDPETKAVRWIGKEYEDGGKFSALETLSRLNRVFFIRESTLVCIFPPEVFSAFSQVYVMTYMIEGAPIHPYFEIFKISYEKKTVVKRDGEYELAEYTPDSDAWFRKRTSELVTLCESKQLNNYVTRSLSKLWFANNAKNEQGKKLKGHIRYYFNEILHAKVSDIVGEIVDGKDLRQTGLMWTCYKDYKDDIKGKGYTAARRMTAEEKELPQKEYEALEKRLSCFVPCNARATNDYRYRWALAYCISLHYPEMLGDFFINSGVPFDNDKFAIANLIQWIYRSRIRDGESIQLYMPSRRMRNLYHQWIDGDDRRKEMNGEPFRRAVRRASK